MDSGMTKKVLLLAFAAFILAPGLLAVDEIAPTIPRALAAEEGSVARPPPAIAKVGAWILGNKLSLSAIMYFRGGDKSVLPEAQDIAGKLGLKAPQFPADGRKQGDPGLIKVV